MAPEEDARRRASIETEEILEAALSTFAEKGFDGTSVRDIARRLGGSHNLIRVRIGTKEQLWYAAVDHGFAQLFASLATAFDVGTYESDLERYRAVVTRFVEANANRPALSRIIAQEAQTDGPRIEHLYQAWIRPFAAFGAIALPPLRERGLVRNDSVPLMYFFMTFGAGGAAAYPALARLLGGEVAPDDPGSARRHAEEAVEFMFDGLLVDDQERASRQV